MTQDEKQAAIEEGWSNCVGYLSDAPSQTRYVAGVPERTGARELWRELTIARQRGLNGGEPDTRVQMVERFMPYENAIIEEVHHMMNKRQDMTGAHAVVRLVAQALLYGPQAALKG